MGSHASPKAAPRGRTGTARQTSASERRKGNATEATAIFVALRRVVRRLRLADNAAEARTGVSAAQLFVLSRLSSGDSVSIRDLASRTMTDPSSVSVAVAKLEARKLVSRAADPEDRRRAVVAITARGRSLLAKTPELPQVRLLDAVSALPKARRVAIERALLDLVSAMGASDVEPTMFFDGEEES